MTRPSCNPVRHFAASTGRSGPGSALRGGPSMKSLGIPLLALVPTIEAVSARAEDDPFAKNGVYLGVGASYGVNLFEDSIEDAFPGHAKISDTWGANARVGYRFHKF